MKWNRQGDKQKDRDKNKQIDTKQKKRETSKQKDTRFFLFQFLPQNDSYFDTLDFKCFSFVLSYNGW